MATPANIPKTVEQELREAIEDFERAATRLSNATEPFSKFFEEGLPIGKKCIEAKELVEISKIGRGDASEGNQTV